MCRPHSAYGDYELARHLRALCEQSSVRVSNVSDDSLLLLWHQSRQEHTLTEDEIYFVSDVEALIDMEIDAGLIHHPLRKVEVMQ